MVTRERLQRSELFAGFQSELLDGVLGLAQARSYPSGGVIFREDEPAGDMYLLEDGTVGLYVTAPSGGQTLAHAVRAAGEPFGWDRLVEQPRYSATARCMTDVQAIALDATRLARVLGEDPTAGYHFMRRLAALATGRLTDTRAQLRSILANPIISAG